VGDKRKPVLFTYNGIKLGIEAVVVPEDQFLFAASYANGTRISEIINIRKGNIRVEPDFVHINTPVLKKRDSKWMRGPPINRRSWENDARIAGEAWLANIILGYIENKGDEDRLIPYSIRTAQRRFDKYFNCTSHSFRHTRATHCFTELKMNMRQVAEWFRLSYKTLNDWAMRYGHLNVGDLETHVK